MITNEIEKNFHRSEKIVKRNYTENFPTFTNNNKNKVTNQRRGKYNFHKSPSKDFPSRIKNSNKKVLFNSFFNNNEIVAEKKNHSFKPKNENISQISNFLENSLKNNFPSKLNEFKDIERLCDQLDRINVEVSSLKKKETNTSKLLYSSVLKFPENEYSCKKENSTKVKVEDEIPTKIIPSTKTVIEKIEISSMSNMEKLLKKIEENQLKLAEIEKINFKNLPRIVSGENLIQKSEREETFAKLDVSSIRDKSSDDSNSGDFDVLEKESLKMINDF